MYCVDCGSNDCVCPDDRRGEMLFCDHENALVVERLVCRNGHRLSPPTDHCGQRWCEGCRAHMTPRLVEDEEEDVSWHERPET